MTKPHLEVIEHIYRVHHFDGKVTDHTGRFSAVVREDRNGLPYFFKKNERGSMDRIYMVDGGGEYKIYTQYFEKIEDRIITCKMVRGKF